MLLKIIRLLSVAASLAFMALITTACANTIDNHDEAKFRGWLMNFSKDAKQQGISDATIYTFLENAKYLPQVIKLDRKQPDTTKTFDEYLKGLITAKRIKEAREQLAENKTLLEEIGNKYKVQPRFIVALWSIESNFGKNTGSFDVVNSLATLAYEGRRAAFFKSELIKALKILDDGHIHFDDMKGSWAGAMGQTQFMPSSYLKMSVDYDNDGKRDIWQTKADVFASIANYLATTGWDDNATWGREVKLPKNFSNALIGKTIVKPLTEWQKLGVKKADGSDLITKNNLNASIIKPEQDKDRAYLIYSNYKTILDWNRSLYFATAVGLLSDSMIK